MKFSEHWLREWINPPLNTQQLCEQLTMAGLEIESVTPTAGKFDKVVIGLVTKVTPHPDAERLRVCQVDTGASEPLSIVCGAANVRTDLKVAVALIGANLPNGIKIKAAKLRGIESQGMICSVAELGMAETSAGIMELPAEAPLGQELRHWLQLDDTEIDIHVTPNRGDCLSIAGIAREIAVLNDCDYKAPTINPVSATIRDQFSVTVLDPVDCPHYLGRVLRGVNSSAKTPIWMIEKLRRSGLRSIHPVVDITNYVLLELGQPLHAFDLNKLNTNIVVRLAREQEKITLLDGKEIDLDAKTLVIADQQGPQALAGIMGGLASAVSDVTTDIFLESAFFDPITIAGRARSYGLNTDSAYRFERGVDPNLSRHAIERATQLIMDIAGGQAGPVIEITHKDNLPKPAPILLRASRLERVLGITVPREKIEIILSRLGMQLKQIGNDWQVIAPSYRFDLNLEEDLIEEVIRIYGYHKIPATSLHVEMRFSTQSEQELPLERLRQSLNDRGYHEAITYSFIAPKWQQLIEPEVKPLTLINPISTELSVMRSSLWPGLLNAVAYNQNRQQERVRLFETGLRFDSSPADLKQERVLAGAVAGDLLAEQWGTASRAVDFFDVKGDLESLMALSGMQSAFSFISDPHPALHPGQSCAILQSGQVIGYLGALHPALLQTLELIGPIYVFELKLEPLIKRILPQFQSLSKFPAIRRDISFLVKQTFPVKQILDVITQTAGDLLVNLFLFDVYQGKGMEEGVRSLALGLLWQHPTRTLVDDEVNELMTKVIAALKENFAITLRD